MVAHIPFALRSVRRRREDNAHGVEVIDLVEADALGLHLVPYRIRSLDSFLDLEAEAGRPEGLIDGTYELVDLRFHRADVGVDFLGYLLEGRRFLVAQPYILHFALHPIQTQPVGQRDENEHCLAQNLVPLVFGHIFYGPAVVQAVCELYQHDAHVVIDSQQYALEVLGLYALAPGLVLLVQHGLYLRQALDQGRDLVAEEVAYVLHSIVRILDDVMKKGGRNRLVAETDLADDYHRNRNRMYYIRLARAPAHTLMGGIGELEGLLDHGQLIPVRATFRRGLLEGCVFPGNLLQVLFCEFRCRGHFSCSCLKMRIPRLRGSPAPPW